MTSSVLQNKIPFFILYSDIDLFISKDFGSLYFVHNHSPYKTKLNSKSLKGIFLGYSRTKKDYKCFCPSIGRYILFADLTFSSLNMGFPHLLLHKMVTMITYSIRRLNSGESTSETVTCKNPLQFQDPLQTYKDDHFLHLCHRQPQYQTICKNQMRLSPLNNLIILLPMIFPLHNKKTHTFTQHPLSNFISYSHLSSSFRSSISSLNSRLVPKNVSMALSIPGWTQAMQEKMTVL